MANKTRRKGDGRKRLVKRGKAVQTRRAMADFDTQIKAISSLDIKDLASVVALAALEEHVPRQMEVIEECLKRILNLHTPSSQTPRVPRQEQVRTLRRLIYGKGDTILVARTGFGKSLIFHAYSVLTRKTTLQIIPLSKLGDEQLYDIQLLDNTNPCLITAETKKQHPDMLGNFKAGLYTHVLLGPEQASSKEFRDALKLPEVQQRIGLVAIDECHLVKQWKDFRAGFTMLGELRQILRKDIVWFGCSATLDSEAEQMVLQSAGFRCLGHLPYQTEIVRTSIDRPDISLHLQAIPRRKLQQFDSLYFLLSQAVDQNAQRITPEAIPKTVVFIDGRKSVDKAAQYLRRSLQTLSLEFHSSQQYNNSSLAMRSSVSHVINTFTAHVARYDRDVRYTEFKKASSSTRIMIATTALGMGVNIPDIERVVVWNFPIGSEPGDVWQRIGRGGRGEGRKSVAYLFLPYWAFSVEGIDPSVPHSNTLPYTQQRKQKRTRNMLPRQRALIRSRLNASFVPDDISETESVDSNVSVASQERIFGVGTKTWTRTELKNRSKMTSCWKAVCDGSCQRAPFLEYLGEGKFRQSSNQEPLELTKCCNGCHPDKFGILDQAPEIKQPLKAPGSNTRAGIALNFIDRWAVSMARVLFPIARLRFPLPPSAYMDTEARWQLAWMFNKNRPNFWTRSTIDSLLDDATLLRNWIFQQESLDQLLAELKRISLLVDNRWQVILAERKNAKSDREVARNHQTRPEVVTEAVMDNNSAVQVARQEAIKACLRQGDVGAALVLSPVLMANDPDIQHAQSLLQRARSQTLETDRIIMARRAHEDENHGQPSDAMSCLVLETQLDPALPTPDIRGTETQCDTANNDRVLDSQCSLVPETQCDPDTPKSPVFALNTHCTPGPPLSPLPGKLAKRAASIQLEKTPKRRRIPLLSIETNQVVRSGLGFASTSRVGRTRVLTSKGKENFILC